MLQLRPAATLDGGDYGWLKAKHHFCITATGNADTGTERSESSGRRLRTLAFQGRTRSTNPARREHSLSVGL
jgi:hypothetical protein